MDYSDPHNEERHQDFSDVREAINSAKKAIILAFIPIMFAGVGMLVANHFGQQNLVHEVSQLNDRLTDMSVQMDQLNERVIVMWAGGNWENKFKVLDSK